MCCLGCYRRIRLREKWGVSILPTVVNILTLLLIIFLITGETQDSLRRPKKTELRMSGIARVCESEPQFFQVAILIG